ncbi:MAG TPA: polysaccharide deacetylase family protein, partial [Caulobacteraceae bacterium]|nr:polysaccharide deacetylase family protein [Caulobacteraceae bacterium]
MQTRSLAERLGYAPDARLVILNCDDLGSSHAANLASLEAVEQGVATSATLMVPCPWAREAVDLFAGKDVGVHLTLTAEYRAYRWRSLTGAASLHDDDGYLPDNTPAVFAKATAPDVRAECRAQIDQALAWGVDVTHLDSHMGANMTDPRFYEIYLELAEEYRVPVRMAGRGAEQQLGFPIHQPADDRGLVYPDDFVFRWKDSTADLMRRRVPKMAPGSVTEFLAHPVLDGPELRGYDRDAAQVRVDDHACAVSPAVR